MIWENTKKTEVFIPYDTPDIYGNVIKKGAFKNLDEVIDALSILNSDIILTLQIKYMKLKIQKAGSLNGNNWYTASIMRGNGGVSSLIQSRTGPFWFAFKVFLNPINYWRALTTIK